MNRFYRPRELPDGLAFRRGWLSAGAVQVAEALQAAGFDGYLVGGCVRDILLRRRPKDFDIATDAGPEQVRRLFRRARIIGRRFKIVHVRAGREIIEVATYRAAAGDAGRGGARVRLSQLGRVVDDNVFGGIEDDAARRDFTVNALYYDPVGDRVVDFLGGIDDARCGILRIIGEPRARFTEDPVRMLRAVRFRAKLGLAWADDIAPAIAGCRDLLDDVPAARLYDEVLKMFHHGHARAAWDGLCEQRLAEHLFPLTVDALGDGGRGKSGGDNREKIDGGRDQNPSQTDPARAAAMIRLALENTDRRVGEGKSVIPAFLFTVLLWRPFCLELAARRRRTPGEFPDIALAAAASAVFGRERRVLVPRRVASVAAEIWAMQPELEARRPRAVLRLLETRRFRAAYDFLLLRRHVGEVSAELADWWTDIQVEHPPPAPTPAVRRHWRRPR